MTTPKLAKGYKEAAMHFFCLAEKNNRDSQG
jgi:hypothetical protein